MPKVNFVKKARKDNSVVKEGESYYWWKFKFSGKHYSKEKPKQSQLTQSEFLANVYELGERLQNLTPSSFDDLDSEIKEIAEEFRSLAEECEDKRMNMPEQLQESDTGILLEERAENCAEISDSLESIDCEDTEEQIREEVNEELGEDENIKKEELEEEVNRRIVERLEEIIDEAQSFQYEGN